ncbi:MAG TPA: ATP-binding cassette domain-containing protein [Acidimicrobiia bacterium]|nr:ATP-binding cassette domain-containing protein [Acidimicrobiia bacterium]
MLEVDGLYKHYGDVVALDGCSFKVEPGRMVGFLGPNGAGKTTTMRAIFGLLRPDAGSVRWRGELIDARARNGFGYMPEQRGLYPKMRVKDQLVYFARLHGVDADEASQAAERWLTDLGLAERMQDPLETLSHGNQQRVQLAAALVHEPELLILDEPFSGLDPLGAETMANVLRARAADGACVVFSSHQLDLVEDLCDDVAIIHRGRIVLEGDVHDLKTRSDRRIVELDLSDEQLALISELDGVLDSRFDGRRHILTVTKGTDLRGLLATLQHSEDLEHFVFTTPSLADLFREAVA